MLEELTPPQLQAFVETISKRSSVSRAEDAIQMRLCLASLFDDGASKEFESLVLELLGQKQAVEAAVDDLRHFGIGKKES